MRYNSMKVNEVPTICAKYKGREQELCQKLDRKYSTGMTLQQQLQKL